MCTLHKSRRQEDLQDRAPSQSRRHRATHIVTENLNDAPAPPEEKGQMPMAAGRSQVNSPRPDSEDLDSESRLRVSESPSLCTSLVGFTHFMNYSQ